MPTWSPPVLKQTWRRWCGHASSSTLYTKFVLTVSQIICYGPINQACQIILAHCIVCNFACVHVHPWRKVNYLYQLTCFSEYQLATYFLFFFLIFWIDLSRLGFGPQPAEIDTDVNIYFEKQMVTDCPFAAVQIKQRYTYLLTFDSMKLIKDHTITFICE